MNPYARHLGSRDPLKVVATTARHLEQLSVALGPARIEESPAPGKWSPHEILCHLADCELVFRNTETKKEFVVKLTNDPRRWCMTDSAVAVNVSALIPAATPAGQYAVYLNLPDPAASIHSRSEYSIRLANKDVWEDATGYNSLLHKVTVSTAQ